MHFNRHLLSAIAIAVLWAVLVFIGYALVIAFWSPFSDWDANRQSQLFQSAIGIAGFGGGLIALFFTGQQLRNLLAEPDLQVTFLIGDKEFRGGPVRVDAARIEEACRLDMKLRVVNSSDNICELWQVVLSVEKGVSVEHFGVWRTIDERKTSYQAHEGEALFRDIPLALNPIALMFDPVYLTPSDDGDRRWSGKISVEAITQNTKQTTELPVELASQILKSPGVAENLT